MLRRTFGLVTSISASSLQCPNLGHNNVLALRLLLDPEYIYLQIGSLQGDISGETE